MCHENGKPLGDGTKKIFFNINGKNAEETSQKVINLLKYMKNTTDECANELNDENVSRIHKHVVELKKSRGKEHKYMLFGELMDDEK